ncbi:3-beta hydroxysteroid dehydrogenase/isomerase domain-containing protein [[Candida] zeylanoides]
MTVLITGGTGFVGTYCIIDALLAGYSVRTTVRSLAKGDKLKASLLATSPKLTKDLVDAQLSIFEADLTRDKGWEEAIRGSEYILHVASPFPLNEPKNEDDLIIPAKEGALRVLRTADKVGGVKKIVLTSSVAAIGFGHPAGATFDESTWTELKNVKNAYIKSKTLAERAAWDYIRDSNSSIVLTTINPVAIVGPVVAGSPNLSTSTDIVKTLTSGKMRLGAPNLRMGFVDVRDVAKLHVEALTNKASDGERFLATSGPKEWTLVEAANALREGLPAKDPAIKNLPSRTLPSWLVKLAAHFDAEVKAALPFIDTYSQYNSAKAQRVFQWTPIPVKDALLATYNSLKAR